MEGEKQRSKIDAIYDLREAVEVKARAEQELETNASAAARDALLAAQLDVEAKTQDAIDVCHECGEAHASDQKHAAGGAQLVTRQVIGGTQAVGETQAVDVPHSAIASNTPEQFIRERHDNVVHVDFRRDSESITGA